MRDHRSGVTVCPTVPDTVSVDTGDLPGDGLLDLTGREERTRFLFLPEALVHDADQTHMGFSHRVSMARRLRRGCLSADERSCAGCVAEAERGQGGAGE